jgi:hypothetical protein
MNVKTKLTKNEIIALIAAREKQAYDLYTIVNDGNTHSDLAQNYFGEFLACQKLMMQIRGELEA